MTHVDFELIGLAVSILFGAANLARVVLKAAAKLEERLTSLETQMRIVLKKLRL
jgi:hypothetical protein